MIGWNDMRHDVYPHVGWNNKGMKNERKSEWQ